MLCISLFEKKRDELDSMFIAEVNLVCLPYDSINYRFNGIIENTFSFLDVPGFEPVTVEIMKGF